MRKKALVAGLFLGIFAAGLTGYADIKNSHHDFSSASWSGGEICRPCHTPHNANTTVQGAPLWNHEVTTATFQVYSSATLDATPGQPTGVSKLCLSCHDGTVAIENHGGYSGGTRYILENFKIGTDLSDDHPISIEYTSQLANQDGGLYDPTTQPSGLGGTIAEDLLFEGKVECATCHDVHVSRNTEGCSGCHFVHGQMTTRTLSLRIDNAGSALCLTCHKK